MKLIYCYIKKFRNIEDQEVNLSDKWNAHFKEGRLTISLKSEDKAKAYLYGNSFMRDLFMIVGKTGSGKTNFLQLIGMDMHERYKTRKTDAYLLLYKMSDSDDFAIEKVGLNVSGITDKIQDKEASTINGILIGFTYNLMDNAINGVRALKSSDTENTYIVNAFDRYAFASCPYDDIKIENIREQDGFIHRRISQFGKSSVSLECECLKEYLGKFHVDSIKRKASLVIRWDNWQDKLKIELSSDLMKSDYWTYKSRAEEQRDENIKKGKRYDTPIKYPKGTNPKSRFIHDLMTDFAIYLRKWAQIVDPEFPENLSSLYGITYDLGIDNPRELPDWEKIGILKRIDWLCQYLDYHTDEMFANRGLLWQIGSDIKDLFSILGKMDSKYFTDEEFSIPVMDIDNSVGSSMYDLFERMDNYRPDEVGVFTQKLLPYNWTYISSGEYQYAKVWGIMEEYAVRVKVLNEKESYDKAIQPKLILLLDEPETYMHPEMCRCFLDHTKRILAKRNPNVEIQILISTHSPFMLSDILSSQIIRMDFDEKGRCIISQDSEPSFAANIHSIMADKFFLDYTIGEQARTFLQDKFNLFMAMLQQGTELTDDQKMEVSKMNALLPHIGDKLIRFSFKNLVEKLT